MEKELIKAQKDYIDFLGKCYDQAFRMAHVHGYRVNENDIITGIKMRDKITECDGKMPTSEPAKALDLLDVIARFLPLTWFVYIMWKLDFLKRDYDGCYRGDPGMFYINRWIFRYIPIQGKTKKGTKFCGNWHWFRLMFWEVHLLIIEKSYKAKKERVRFP